MGRRVGVVSTELQGLGYSGSVETYHSVELKCVFILPKTTLFMGIMPSSRPASSLKKKAPHGSFSVLYML